MGVKYENKLGDMARAITLLESLCTSAQIQFAGTWNTANLPTQETVRSVQQGIQALKGEGLAPGDINPWERAIADDDYLTNTWLPAAEQYQKGLETAMGMSSNWSLSEVIHTYGGAVIDAAPTKNELFAGGSILVMGLIAVAVIVVFK